LNQRRIVLITLGVMTSLFLASMESTVVSTAMPTIVAQLGGLESYSWVFAIYMLTSTTVGPIFGRLSDIYGRRPLYLAAIGIFMLGSLLCGLAQNMPQLIAARAVQGLGAGGLLPLAFIIVGDIFTFEQRAKVQGLFSGVWGVSSVLGPLIGGFFVDSIGWQWIFFINLIPAALAAALVYMAWRGVPRPSVAKPSIDYAGSALLVISVSSLLLGLNELGTLQSSALLVLGVVSLLGLLWVENRAVAPIIPLGLFRDRMFAVACAHGILVGWALFGSMSYVPLFVQGVLGTTATVAGSTLTPMLIAWVLASIVGSRLLLRFSYRSIAISGMVGLIIGGFFMTMIGVDTSRLTLMINLSLLGIGMGFSIPAFLIAVQSTVAKNQLGAATATLQFSRNIGGTLGVSVLGVILSMRLASYLREAGLDPANLPLDSLLGEGGATTAIDAALRPALALAVRDVFIASFIAAFLAFVVTLLAPRGNIAELRDRNQASVEHEAAPLPAGD
jgi:EmrB/QacA subfamily drug resistance transporter